jgi:hypothetical protein
LVAGLERVEILYVNLHKIKYLVFLILQYELCSCETAPIVFDRLAKIVTQPAIARASRNSRPTIVSILGAEIESSFYPISEKKYQRQV